MTTFQPSFQSADLVLGDEVDSIAVSSSCVKSSLENGNGKAADDPSSATHFGVENNMLYGRQDQTDRLLSCFKLLSYQKRHNLVLITGASGTGKSTLALTLKEHVESSNRGYFVSGKFDQLEQPASFEPFRVALNALCVKLLQNCKDHHAVRDSILAELGGFEIALLMTVVHSLGKLLGTADASEPALEDDAGNYRLTSELQTRFCHIICRFLKLVCSKERLVVLFLDDLQWSDKESLALLESILLDTTITGLLVVGACRGNEVAFCDDLSVLLRRLEDEHISTTRIIEIRVDDLSLDSVGQLVADTLELPVKTCALLAQHVHQQTNGNPFATKQLLQLLLDSSNHDAKQLLELAKDSRTFHAVISDPAELVRMRLVALPQEIQDFLIVCACLGAEFEQSLLERALGENCDKRLDVVQELELIVPVHGSKFRFAHDKIQEASYKLVPPHKRELVHLEVGSRLWKALDEEGNDTYVVHVVHQLCRCLPLITKEDQRVALAWLCLQATQRVKKASSLNTAVTYLDVGLSLLPRRNWRDEYSLSLELYFSAAEIHYAVGDYEECEDLIHQILENARCVEDKLRAKTVLVYSLGSRYLLPEAVDTAIDILRELREPIPRNPRALTILKEFMQVRRKLAGLADADILSLPRMMDKKLLAAVRIMNVAFVYAFSGRPTCAALLAIRCVKLTLKHGLSAMSAVGFSIFSMVLVGAGQIGEAYRFGKLAMELLKMFGSQEWRCRVHAFVWGLINTAKLPLRECLCHLQEAAREGTATGDIEFAMMSSHLFFAVGLWSSQPLEFLYEDAKEKFKWIVSYHQDNVGAMHSITLQAVANLLGLNDNPFELTGEHENEKDVLQSARQQNSLTILVGTYAVKLIIAVVMNEYDMAEDICNHLGKLNTDAAATFVWSALKFMIGFTKLIQAQRVRKGRRARLRVARRCLKQLKTLAVDSPFNEQHRVYILEAELLSVNGKPDACVEKYKLAITAAEKEKRLMEKALALERVSLFVDNAEERLDCLSKAKSAYAVWGARIKVLQLHHIR